jgi:hypothetical protein
MYRIFIAVFLILSPCFAFAALPIFPPGFQFEGRSAASLSADWWKWAMSSPEEIDPVRDLTGEHCAIGQTGKVWFLSGGFGSSKIHRSCVIPADKYIFFPVVNMSYWAPTENSGYTCEMAKSHAAMNNDTALDLFVEVDGVAVKEVRNYRARTEDCFDIFERVPKRFHAYNAYPSASDGYWILLRPLTKGKHTIKFGGRYNRESGAFGRMVQDIEYEVLVK